MRNREDAFDITKMILSIFVIGAHAGLYPDIMNPLYRIAVPMFFFSYFFFKSPGQDKTANKARLKKFVVRNLRLYGFWFVALLPLTLIIRDYFAQGFVPGLLTLLHNFLFYSTFRASWYLIALCTAMVILYFLSGVTGNKGLLWISAPIYVLYCLFSNYYGLFGECDLWNSFCNGYRTVFVTLCNNFPAGFLWITLGKMFAEGKISIPAKVTRWMLPLSVMLLYAEQITVCACGKPAFVCFRGLFSERKGNAQFRTGKCFYLLQSIFDKIDKSRITAFTCLQDERTVFKLLCQTGAVKDLFL